MDSTELNVAMDKIFKYKIGDIVQSSVLDGYQDRPHGVSQSTKDDKSWITLHYSEEIKFQVIERSLQQCHGGTQVFYKVRPVKYNGIVFMENYVLFEFEISKSEGYKNRHFIDKESIQKYIDEWK